MGSTTWCMKPMFASTPVEGSPVKSHKVHRQLCNVQQQIKYACAELQIRENRTTWMLFLSLLHGGSYTSTFSCWTYNVVVQLILTSPCQGTELECFSLRSNPTWQKCLYSCGNNWHGRWSCGVWLLISPTRMSDYTSMILNWHCGGVPSLYLKGGTPSFYALGVLTLYPMLETRATISNYCVDGGRYRHQRSPPLLSSKRWLIAIPSWHVISCNAVLPYVASLWEYYSQ